MSQSANIHETNGGSVTVALPELASRLLQIIPGHPKAGLINTLAQRCLAFADGRGDPAVLRGTILKVIDQIEGRT